MTQTNGPVPDLTYLFKKRPLIWYSLLPPEDIGLHGVFRPIVFKDGRIIFTEFTSHENVVGRAGLRDGLLQFLQRPWLRVMVVIGGGKGLNSVLIDDFGTEDADPPEWWTEKVQEWIDRLIALARRVLLAQRASGFRDYPSTVYDAHRLRKIESDDPALREYIDAISSIEGYLPARKSREQGNEPIQKGGEAL